MSRSEPSGPIHVLIVDDSAVIRQTLGALLSLHRDLTVQTAVDPIIAMEKMKRKRPDVIVLDLEMPRMDGITFLRKLMGEDPIPVVVCSALTGRGTREAVAAIEEGAVEIITKPQLGVRDFIEDSAMTIVDSVRAAARARVRRRGPPRARTERHSADVVLPPPSQRSRVRFETDRLVAIGASTGGTEAIREVLEVMPADCPGIVIVQHMPEGFTRAFAERIDRSCRIEVKEAEAGDRLLEGRALIAPGNRHLLVRRSGPRYLVELSDGPLVSRHRPSVDVLFRSVASAAGPNAVGVLMTGMGSDGAAGLLEMRSAGAATIAQDEASCVVFGMPSEAIRLGAAEEILPCERIAGGILGLCRGGRRGPGREPVRLREGRPV